jgi:hypothetical protein
MVKQSSTEMEMCVIERDLDNRLLIEVRVGTEFTFQELVLSVIDSTSCVAYVLCLQTFCSW